MRDMIPRRRSLRILLAATALVALAPLVWSFGPRDQTRIERVKQVAANKETPSFEVLKVSAPVDQVAWSPDSTTLAVLTQPGQNKTRSILLYDVANARQQRTIYESTDDLLSLKFWPDGTTIGCASWRTGPKGVCEILMWNSTTGKKIEVCGERRSMDLACSLLQIRFRLPCRRTVAIWLPGQSWLMHN